MKRPTEFSSGAEVQDKVIHDLCARGVVHSCLAIVQHVGGSGPNWVRRPFGGQVRRSRSCIIGAWPLASTIWPMRPRLRYRLAPAGNVMDKHLGPPNAREPSRARVKLMPNVCVRYGPCRPELHLGDMWLARVGLKPMLETRPTLFAQDLSILHGEERAVAAGQGTKLCGHQMIGANACGCRPDSWLVRVRDASISRSNHQDRG